MASATPEEETESPAPGPRERLAHVLDDYDRILDADVGEIDHTGIQAAFADRSPEEEIEVTWIDEFRTVREQLLRVFLEEVAWKLEHRGHHAWLAPADDEGIEDEGDTARSLGLFVVPSDQDLERSEPSVIAFRPHPDTQRVNVELVDPNTRLIRAVTGLTLDELTEDRVIDLATSHLRSFLLRGRIPPPPRPTPATPRSGRPSPAESVIDRTGWTGLGTHHIPSRAEAADRNRRDRDRPRWSPLKKR